MRRPFLFRVTYETGKGRLCHEYARRIPQIIAVIMESGSQMLRNSDLITLHPSMLKNDPIPIGDT